VKPLMQGRPVESWRSHLVVENHQARLVLADRWKYMVGAGGEIREMLVDLERDPGELQNFASDPAYRQRLETGRRLLKQWYASHGLTLDAEYLVERESGDR
jgi:arylsulfatase A-like enzyme